MLSVFLLQCFGSALERKLIYLFFSTFLTSKSSAVVSTSFLQSSFLTKIIIYLLFLQHSFLINHLSLSAALSFHTEVSNSFSSTLSSIYLCVTSTLLLSVLCKDPLPHVSSTPHFSHQCLLPISVSSALFLPFQVTALTHKML